MGKATGIEWTDSTWNPIYGCSRVSEGCRNCYAEMLVAGLELLDVRATGLREFVGGFAMTAAVLMVRRNLR